MKAEFLKMAGVSSEQDFYKKYPTQEAFFMAFPNVKKMKLGAEVDPTEPVKTIKADAYQGNPNTTGAFPVGSKFSLESDAYRGSGEMVTPGLPMGDEFVLNTEPFIKPEGPDYTEFRDKATLGLFGLSAGLNAVDSDRAEQRFNNSIQRRESTPRYDYAYMHGRNTSGGTEFQPIVMAEKGALIKSRPNSPGFFNNVEVENDEYIVLPDGSSEVVRGPEHSDKYKVGNKTLTGTHTKLPKNTMVFSDKLTPADFHSKSKAGKMSAMHSVMEDGGLTEFELPEATMYTGRDANKTFAELAKRYDVTKYKKILDNPFSHQADKNTASIMVAKNEKILEQLFRDQQAINGNSSGEPEFEKGGKTGDPNKFKVLRTEVDEKGNQFQVVDIGNGKNRRQLVIPETSIKSRVDAKVGDYYRDDKGALIKVTGEKSNLLEYTGKDADTVFSNNKALASQYAYLEKIFQDPKVKTEFANKVREAAKNSDYFVTKKGKKVPEIQTLLNSKPLEDDEIIKNFMEMQKRNLSLKARGADFNSIPDANDKGSNTNKRLSQEFANAGVPLDADSRVSAIQQAAFLGFRDLLKSRDAGGLDSEVMGKIKGLTIGAEGPEEEGMTANKRISPIDGAYTNNTARQIAGVTMPSQFTTESVTEFEDFNAVVPPQINGITKPNMGTYEREQYDLSQAIPSAYALAQSQEVFPYAIPEISAERLRPQTLNIQSQLQDIDNMGMSATRAGADPSMTYAMALDAKNKAFQAKQNFDAQSRFQTDNINLNTELRVDSVNAQLFDGNYNDRFATAKGKQAENKQAAISSLVTNRAQFNQNESVKELYSKNFMPSYSYDADTKTWVPVANKIYNQKTPVVSNVTSNLFPENIMQIDVDATNQRIKR